MYKFCNVGTFFFFFRLLHIAPGRTVDMTFKTIDDVVVVFVAFFEHIDTPEFDKPPFFTKVQNRIQQKLTPFKKCPTSDYRTEMVQYKLIMD